MTDPPTDSKTKWPTILHGHEGSHGRIFFYINNIGILPSLARQQKIFWDIWLHASKKTPLTPCKKDINSSRLCIQQSLKYFLVYDKLQLKLHYYVTWQRNKKKWWHNNETKHVELFSVSSFNREFVSRALVKLHWV